MKIYEIHLILYSPRRTKSSACVYYCMTYERIPHLEPVEDILFCFLITVYIYIMYPNTTSSCFRILH